MKLINTKLGILCNKLVFGFFWATYYFDVLGYFPCNKIFVF
jgi:hypothetical protein